MSNFLISEKSLYLQEHAQNPVRWYPWGASAWRLAMEEDKPVLVSIGYSSCHWCHVMARESFASPYIAEIMNQHFICIKVDREEYPEVDALYMEAVQMIAGRGGWPLNVFCLPDKRPFLGGTYFPPADRGHGIVPWPQLLMRVAEHYERSKDELIENAVAISENLKHLNTLKSSGDIPGIQTFVNLATHLAKKHDDLYGGFGEAPKFPCGMLLEFLMTLGEQPEALPIRPRLDAIIEKSLEGMAKGGLYDQMGGSFMRYTVDREWKRPHYEKMLYDNALLLAAYARAYASTKKPLFRAIVEECIEWADKTMKGPEGLFYASKDAETAEGEGALYQWSAEDCILNLGQAEAALFMKAYGISKEGKSLPIFSGTWEERLALSKAREKLKQVRDQRPQPKIDPKYLLYWNALWLRGLIQAGISLEREDYIREALTLLERILKYFEKEGKLHALAYGNECTKEGGFVDYAALLEALVVVASQMQNKDEALFLRYKAKAEALAKSLFVRFKDREGLGFFERDREEPPTIVRQKLCFDNAMPSGHSLVLSAFLKLYQWTQEPYYLEILQELSRVYTQFINEVPTAIAYGLEALLRVVIELGDSLPVLNDCQDAPQGAPSYKNLILEIESMPDSSSLLGESCAPGDCSRS